MNVASAMKMTGTRRCYMIRRAASKPFSCGSLMSMRIRSGAKVAAIATPLAVLREPHHLMTEGFQLRPQPGGH